MAEVIEFTPVGTVSEVSGPPPGEGFFRDRRFRVRIYPEYIEGLSGLEAGRRIQIIFWFHLSEGYELITYARGLQKTTGVFNCRSPYRPNGIGVTEVTIVRMEEDGFTADGGDLFQGTPILDLKPCG